MAKIWLLEKENKALSDENLALKLENSEIKEFLIKDVYEKNDKNKKQRRQPGLEKFKESTHMEEQKKTGRLENPWEFPRQTARQQQQLQVPTQVICKNSFSLLADCEDRKRGEQEERLTEKDRPWGVDLDDRQEWVSREDLSTESARARHATRGQTNQTASDFVRTRETTPKKDFIASKTTVMGDKPSLRVTDASPKLSAADSNEERRFVATARNVKPGIYDYNEVVTKRPAQAQSSLVGDSNEANKSQSLFYTEQSQNRQGLERRQPQSFDRRGRRKPTIAFIGDSILKGIRKQEINRCVTKYYTVVKTFSGATVEDMQSYAVPTLNKCPDGIIIHCGTNNLRNDQPEEIANKIINVAVKAKKSVQRVAISSILPRGDSDLMESKRVQVNALLEESLRRYDIGFINHGNFDDKWQNLLYDDGIHLNQRGTNLLGGNIVKFLNQN